MPKLSFSPSWTQEVELTRCRISSSCLLGPKKSSWRDAGSRLLGPKRSSWLDAGALLLTFLHPRSRVDEMPDLVFSSSWTQEVELTRCRISPSRFLGPKKSSSWRDGTSRLLVFLDPRSRRVDEIPHLAFSSSWTQEVVEFTWCHISPSCLLGPKRREVKRHKMSPCSLLGPKRSRRRGIISSSRWHFWASVAPQRPKCQTTGQPLVFRPLRAIQFSTKD